MRLRWMIGIALSATAWAAGDFVGASICAECHPQQYSTQKKTRHAFALRPILATPLPQYLMDRPLRERGGVAFEYQIAANGLEVTVSKGEEKVSVLLEWTFGAGAQGMTAVGTSAGRYFEHRISYYTSAGRPAVTIGHPGSASSSALSALGLLQRAETIYRCFNCHATGVRQRAEGPDLSEMRPGIECERCHNPGRGHVEVAKQNRSKAELAKLVLNAGRFPAKAVVQICAECHRSPDAGRMSPAPELDDPVSIRFQPVGFLASKCFLAGKNFSCLTCHNPHEDAKPRADMFYTEKCLSCHTAAVRPRSRCRRSVRENCLPCHMQRSSPLPYLSFTDHRIRVY